jgi:azurin
MNLNRLVALAIITTPLMCAHTLAQTAKPAPTTPATKAAAGGVRTVEIVGTDQMKYDVATIPAKRSEQLRIRLTSKGTMPKIAMAHNFVLLTLAANVVKFITAGAQSRETDFIPNEMKDQVIAKTALAGAGETVEVTFKVPAAAGEYPFVCTFPGHFQAGMRGTLAVK